MNTGSRFPLRSAVDGDSPLAAERERVVQTLSAHFAQDRLTLAEFEHRLEQAYTASAIDDLQMLITDLPSNTRSPADQDDTPPIPLLAPSTEVPPRGAIFAVMGGHERRGSWIVPRQLKIVVVMGGAEIDLREARFGPGVTEIEIFALMGGATIIVPPGVRVESLGASFMGGFDIKAGDVSTLSASLPVLRLGGVVIMGGVEAETRYLGESAKEAKRRRRRTRG